MSLVHRKLFKYDWVNKGITGQSPVGVDLHWHWRTRALSWRRKWGSPRWAPVTANIGLRLRLYSFLCIFSDKMYTYIIVYIYIHIYIHTVCIYIYIYILCIYIYCVYIYTYTYIYIYISCFCVVDFGYVSSRCISACIIVFFGAPSMVILFFVPVARRSASGYLGIWSSTKLPWWKSPTVHWSG